MKTKKLLYGILISTLLISKTTLINASQTVEDDNLTDAIDTHAYTEGWQETEKGLMWQYEDGTFATDTWIETDGKKYYLKNNGTIYTGWLSYEDNWYYFNNDGTLATNKWIEQYYVDSNGKWDTSKKYYTPGWKKDHVGWWWQDQDGTYPASEWRKIKNEWYYFLNSGYMATGWQSINGQWYYFNSSGSMKTGWLQHNGKWYYLSSSGAMRTGWLNDGGKWYYLSSSGAMKTGWLNDGGKWYYLSSSGAMKTGWLKDDGKWYYLNSSGVMQTGWLYDGDKWYYLNSSGTMQTGWLYVDGKWYYLDSSGAMKTGWLSSNGKWYYLNPTGDMAVSTWIDTYWLDENGIWIKDKTLPVSEDSDSNEAAGSGIFTWPCPGYTNISSDYGYRNSPTSGASTNHQGIDIPAPSGTPIVAAYDGTVIAYGYNSSMGYYVKLQHSNELITEYMHMSKIASLTTNQKVSAGYTIGYVGATGVATGSHLHFGVTLNKKYVSPWDYLNRT